jgi:hypothetical protein
MKKILVFMMILPFLILVTACTNDESKKQYNDLIDVAIETPSKINANELVTIQAKVTQGKDIVDDADEVMFEIRKSGEDHGEMIKGEHIGNGIYEIEKEFTAEGSYIVVAHVTARNMHKMPNETITVGQPTQSVSSANTHHSSEYTSFTFHNKNETFQVNENVTLSATLQYGNEWLTGANVLFEVWKNNKENSEFINAKEVGNGEYKANTAFDSPGTYHVTIHVEKGNIHEHYQSEIKVI